LKQSLKVLAFPAVLMAIILVLAAPAFTAVPEGPITGAVFTTDEFGDQVNGNIYDYKCDVYLNGGPDKQKGPLKDGEYYVQVTDPSGATVLGTSIGSGNDTPFVVENGVAKDLYQLCAILIKASDSSPGYDDTPNPGGVYKVWISASPDFEESLSKTDNFKVRKKDGGGDFDGWLRVKKWYDRDMDGSWDADEPAIVGWKIRVEGDFGFVDDFTEYYAKYIAGFYTVTEYLPCAPTTWMPTTPTSVSDVEVVAGLVTDVAFGNVCKVPSKGGYTMGFWGNKNGLAAMKAFVEGGGTLPGVWGKDFKGLNAYFRGTINAVDMCVMLEAQLLATKLNIAVMGANYGSMGVVGPDGEWMSIATAITNADAILAAGCPDRCEAEWYKNLFDGLNNNCYKLIPYCPCPLPTCWELPVMPE
jgi:hypothetical protein